MFKKEKEYKFDIISFSGRKESGKTELAKICETAGYEKKSFATPLKELVCDLTGLDSIESLNEYKNKPIGVNIDDKVLTKLVEATGLEYLYCQNTTGKLTELSTGRDWLQVIGTDVIRSFDPDWHVKKVIQTIEPGKKYVFDDTRFPNELKALKELGAECWFIIRNKVDNISNHISETALNYRMFDYHIIVNNVSLKEFKKRWKFYFDCHEVTAPLREWTIGQLFMNHHTFIAENTLNKFLVYGWFTHFKDKVDEPYSLVPNESNTGFIGDNDNPFITEDWKIFYNKEVQK